MVRRHLAAIDGIEPAHGFFDQNVASARHLRDATGADDLGQRVPLDARVVNDGSSGRAVEHRGGEKANDVFAIHKVAILVEEETAVEVAVPCDAEVGLVDTYGFSGDRPVFRQQRVRDAIRERRIRVMGAGG